jgi:NTE family protein
LKKETLEIVLALSGGGARGGFHLGVLQYLDDNNIHIKAICSTSIGSIVAASYASGVTPKEQLEIFKSKSLRKMFSFAWFKESIYKVDMDSKVIDALVKKEKLQDLDIPVYITALDLQSGDEVVFSSGDIKTICQASSALVPAFRPVEYEGRVLVDGGFYNHLPFEPLKKYNLPIVGVNLHPLLKKKSRPRLMSYLKKVIAIKMYKRVDAQKELLDFYISTDKLAGFSIFSFKNFDELFEMGYEEAKRVLANV